MRIMITKIILKCHVQVANCADYQKWNFHFFYFQILWSWSNLTCLWYSKNLLSVQLFVMITMSSLSYMLISSLRRITWGSLRTMDHSIMAFTVFQCLLYVFNCSPFLVFMPLPMFGIAISAILHYPSLRKLVVIK